MNQEIYDEIYGSLRKTIILCFAIGWIFVTALEIVTAIVLNYTVGFHVSVPAYILIYIVLPAVVDGIIMGIIIFAICSSKIKQQVKTYIVLTGLILIALVLSSVHSYYPVLLALYCIPIFAATVFLEKKFMIYSTVGSVIGVVISTIIIIFSQESITMDATYITISALIILIILFLVFLLGYLVFRIHLDREKTLADAQNENAKLSKENRFDGLTGLQNHTSFYNVFEHKLMKARHNKNGFSLAMIDIDDFKSVNDTYGHSKGDEILRFVSSEMSEIIGKNGIAFRYGGDEFAIIFHNPDPEGNVLMLEELRKHVCENHALFSEDRTISLSIGYYNVKETSMTAEEIFYKADQALYHAKYSGKNQVYADY